MTTNVQTETTQVYRVFIRAAPERIWEAITSPEWNDKYGYKARHEYDLRPGGGFRGLANEEMKGYGLPDVILDGEILDVDPPHRLMLSWRFVADPTMGAEGFTRVTYEIAEGEGGVSTLTVTHELEGAPQTALTVAGQSPTAGGGWPWILSDLKTFLETGTTLGA